MQLATLTIFICFLAWMSKTKAHEPGQEFTYLSMFLKPASLERFTERETATLASEYLRMGSLRANTRGQRLRRLASESQAHTSEEVLDANDEDFLPSSLPGNDNDGPDEKEQEDAAEIDESETGKIIVEEIEGETKSAEIKISTGDNNDESNDSSQDGSTEVAKIEVPRQVVHAVEHLSSNEPETDADDSSTPKQLATTKTKALNTKDRQRSNSPKPNSLLSDMLDSKDSEMLEVAKAGNGNGEDLKRLSMMLMKIIKQYKVRSMVDVPCRAHSHWMPVFLRHLAESKVNKSFKYYCVDTNKAILKIIKGANDSKINSKFILKRFWRESLPSADLVFSWSGLDNMKEQNVVKYLERLAVSKHKLVLLGSHSGQLEKEGSMEQISRFTLGGKSVNLRREPFKLAKPMRIVGDLSTEGNDKQLYVYEPKGMMQMD